jgi:hypothetical protein
MRKVSSKVSPMDRLASSLVLKEYSSVIHYHFHISCEPFRFHRHLVLSLDIFHFYSLLDKTNDNSIGDFCTCGRSEHFYFHIAQISKLINLNIYIRWLVCLIFIVDVNNLGYGIINLFVLIIDEYANFCN